MRPYALFFVCACGAPSNDVVTPAPKSATSLEACVREFVEHEPMHAVDLVSVREVRSGIALFEVTYGEGHDCEAGCFRSHAFGVVTSCDRVGWIGLADYEHTNRSKLTMFDLAPSDSVLFDESLWKVDGTKPLVRWLARNPRTPDDVRARAVTYSAP